MGQIDFRKRQQFKNRDTFLHHCHSTPKQTGNQQQSHPFYDGNTIFSSKQAPCGRRISAFFRTENLSAFPNTLYRDIRNHIKNRWTATRSMDLAIMAQGDNADNNKQRHFHCITLSLAVSLHNKINPCGTTRCGSCSFPWNCCPHPSSSPSW